MWRSSLNYHLSKLPSTTFIKDIFQLIWEFEGDNDDIPLNALEVELKVLEENIDDFFPTNTDNHVRPATCEKNSQLFIPKSNKVFLVHGHDENILSQTARFLEKLAYEPIILHEQDSKGNTIIEKIEEYTHDACFAVVLYTHCDDGKAKNDADLKARARQNVVFEHGYLISKLGRKRVVAVVQEGVETPGDMSGVVYISLGKEGSWKYKIADEMKAVGLDVDKNKI